MKSTKLQCSSLEGNCHSNTINSVEGMSKVSCLSTSLNNQGLFGPVLRCLKFTESTNLFSKIFDWETNTVHHILKLQLRATKEMLLLRREKKWMLRCIT